MQVWWMVCAVAMQDGTGMELPPAIPAIVSVRVALALLPALPALIMRTYLRVCVPAMQEDTGTEFPRAVSAVPSAQHVQVSQSASLV